MADRGYWARLGRDGIEESTLDDHPLGFYRGTLEHAVLPRLAVLLETLTTETQHEAFVALYKELMHYSRQAHNVMEGLRGMARHLKDLEDDVAYECPDLQERRKMMRDYPGRFEHFDVENYKRAVVMTRDLERQSSAFQVDWSEQAERGRGLNQRLAEEQARKSRESAERHVIWASEQRAKREAELLARLGVLYKTSPLGRIDETVPKSVRQDMPAAEQRLAALGFEIEIDENVRSCIKAWGVFVVYADPRSGGSIRFNVFQGTRQVGTFWMKDQTGNLEEKVEAKLKQLQEQLGK